MSLKLNKFIGIIVSLERNDTYISEGTSERICVQVTQNPFEEKFSVTLIQGPGSQGVYLDINRSLGWQFRSELLFTSCICR